MAKKKEECCPQTCEVYECDDCGMTLVIVIGCGCDDPNGVCLQCCGADMCKQTRK